MAYDTIKLAIADGIGRLELNRPDAANTINVQLARDLEAAVDELHHASPRVVVLTGAGARFCGGGDLGSFAANAP